MLMQARAAAIVVAQETAAFLTTSAFIFAIVTITAPKLPF